MRAALKTLLRGDAAQLGGLLRQPVTTALLLPYVTAIIIGCGMYGVALGLWRSPLMGFYAGIKMPLLIFVTLLVNGLINGMLAQVLGTGLSFRQTLMACLMCFAIFGLIVGSLSPLVIAMVLDSPPPDHGDRVSWYRAIILTHTLVIASAGIVANHKLLRLLQNFAGDARTGLFAFVGWLAGNLFVGAQLSYVLRPFFGTPGLKVEFLRDHPFRGNFYESVWTMLKGVIGPGGLILLAVPVVVSAPICFHLYLLNRRSNPPPPAFTKPN